MSPGPPLFASDLDPAALVGAAGLAVVVGAVGLALVLRARRKPPPPSLKEKVRRAATRGRGDDPDGMIEWLPPDAQRGDRRKALRRVGRLTPIRVTGVPGDPKGGEEGLVVDRSRTGLRFAAERAFAPGDVLYVRAESAPPDSPWVGVTVRHCRDRGDHFVIGCQFREELPWGVLLLFE